MGNIVPVEIFDFKDAFYGYAEFIKSSKLSERDVQRFLKDGLFDFCVRVPAGLSVYVYHESSVPGKDDVLLRGGVWKNRIFSKMKGGPMHMPGFMYVVIDPDDAIGAVGGREVHVMNFKYAYKPDGFCMILEELGYKARPFLRIATEMDRGKNIREGLFFGLSETVAEHSFDVMKGYSPSPRKISVRKEDFFIRGLVYKKLYESREYKDAVLGGAMKNACRMLRDDGLSGEVASAFKELSNVADGSKVRPRDVLEYLGRFSGKDGSCIKRITGNGIYWLDLNGEEKHSSLDDFRSRLRRVRNSAPSLVDRKLIKD